MYIALLEYEDGTKEAEKANSLKQMVKTIEDKKKRIVNKEVFSIMRKVKELPTYKECRNPDGKLFMSSHVRANDKRYSIEEIHALFDSWDEKYPKNIIYRAKNKIVEQFDGVPVKTWSQRYEIFRQNTRCVKCGLEANCYILEKQVGAKNYHFNLYYVDEEGNETLFTKDHIIPKAKGGKDIIENYQVMCSPCNIEKGTTIEGEENESI